MHRKFFKVSEQIYIFQFKAFLEKLRFIFVDYFSLLQRVIFNLLTSLSDLTFRYLRELVDDVIVVSDQDTAEATKFVLSRMKLCVEPSGAIGVAALMRHENLDKYFSDCKNIVVILSGGNFPYKAHLLK